MEKHLEALPDKTRTFTGESHRIFIDGRGFDFQVLEVQPDGTMKLDLQNPDPELTRLLGEGEPRIIYVVSRKGERVRGSDKPKFKVADILYKGESLLPEGGLKIRETVEFTIDELQQTGFITFGPRFTRNYYGANLSAMNVKIPGILDLDLGWVESKIYPR